MRKQVLILCFLASAFCLTAQDRTAEPYATSRVLNQSPAKGLVLDHTQLGGFNYKGPNNSSQVAESDRLELKLRIPLLLKERTKVLLGLQYFQESYEFEEDGLLESNFVLQRLNERVLKKSRLSLSAGHSINSRYFTAFRLEASYAGDYQGIINMDNRYAIYRATAAIGIKKSEHLSYGFGAYYSNSFRRTQILPFAFYNQTFSDKFGLEFTIPVKLKMRYNINDRSLLLVGPQYQSQTYSLDAPNEQGELSIAHFRRQAIDWGATYQYNIDGWTWMQVGMGYLTNFNTRVEDPVAGTAFGMQPGDGAYLKVGLFLSPTRRK